MHSTVADVRMTQPPTPRRGRIRRIGHGPAGGGSVRGLWRQFQTCQEPLLNYTVTSTGCNHTHLHRFNEGGTIPVGSPDALCGVPERRPVLSQGQCTSGGEISSGNVPLSPDACLFQTALRHCLSGISKIDLGPAFIRDVKVAGRLLDLVSKPCRRLCRGAPKTASHPAGRRDSYSIIRGRRRSETARMVLRRNTLAVSQSNECATAEPL